MCRLHANTPHTLHWLKKKKTHTTSKIGTEGKIVVHCAVCGLKKLIDVSIVHCSTKNMMQQKISTTSIDAIIFKSIASNYLECIFRRCRILVFVDIEYFKFESCSNDWDGEKPKIFKIPAARESIRNTLIQFTRRNGNNENWTQIKSVCRQKRNQLSPFIRANIWIGGTCVQIQLRNDGGDECVCAKWNRIENIFTIISISFLARTILIIRRRTVHFI